MGDMSIAEELVGLCQDELRIDDYAVAIARGGEFLQGPLEQSEILGGGDEVALVSGPQGGIGAVGYQHVPFVCSLRKGVEAWQVLSGYRAVQDYVAVSEGLGQLGNQLFQMAIEAGSSPENVMPLIREVKGDGELVHSGVSQLEVLLLTEKRTIGH